MITLSLCLLAYSFRLVELPFWVPSEVRDESRFSVVFINGRKSTVDVVRRSDEVRLRLSVDATNADFGRRPVEFASDKSVIRSSTVDFPLGNHFAVSLRPGFLTAIGKSDWDLGTVTLEAPVQYADRSRMLRPDDFEAERPFVEALLRKCISGFASRRLHSRTHALLGGRQIEAWTADLTGADYVELDAAANALSISLNYNELAGRVSFSWRGKEFIFVLSASKYKENATWKPMDDLVMLIGGKWRVPLGFFTEP